MPEPEPHDLLSTMETWKEDSAQIHQKQSKSTHKQDKLQTSHFYQNLGAGYYMTSSFFTADKKASKNFEMIIHVYRHIQLSIISVVVEN